MLLIHSFSSRTTVVGLCTFLLWWCNAVAVTGLSSKSATAFTTTLDVSKIRAISFDVTGTLLATREPVVKSYHDASIWAKLPNPPTQDEFKQGFKVAFKERSIESPCFGGVEGISGREWWQTTIRRVLYHAKGGGSGDDDDYYTEEEFQRYFRRVYQHFGSPSGYMVLDDALSLLSSITKPSGGNDLVLGITSNTPIRHMESVLPMLDSFHNQFLWFTCSQEIGHEKPAKEIFEHAFEQAKFWLDDPTLEKDSILHIGDSYACDYCGARAYGFQALLLDRSDHPSVTAYQDWLEAPEYPGKSLEDVENNTITSLEEVASLLLPSNQLIN
jgi:REG-2-like HAD superfamily hydrolase